MQTTIQQISGNIVDVRNGHIFAGCLFIENGKIVAIERDRRGRYGNYILPGFIDAHVHIESSMLTPYEFGRLASTHGTVATVSDPHEIANVLGLQGVLYMIENAQNSPIKAYFGAPSCVPATPFETAGAALQLAEIETLFAEYDLKYLSEMMNFPAVLHNDPEVMDKIALAKRYGKRIDGHAPGLRGKLAKQYAAAGITTDHECTTLEEALDKIACGMHILIREGSAAKNFAALAPLLKTHPKQTMLCSDDKHPNDLIVGHINQLVQRAVAQDLPLLSVLRAACVNPVLHYGLGIGLLQLDDRADFIVVEDLTHFKVLQTYINGNLVAENGKSLLPYQPPQTMPNQCHATAKTSAEFAITAQTAQLKAIVALDGQLLTDVEIFEPLLDVQGHAIADTTRDLLKIAVVNRYKNAPPAVGFIKNFGLKQGAIASSVAHDSHNIIAVGCTDEDLCRAVNLVIAEGGGLSVVAPNIEKKLSLPIAGLMSPADGHTVAQQYTEIDHLCKQLGSTLAAPFMTLSFMALPVIPSLKLSDLGLFDVEKFNFTPIFV